MKIDDSLSFPHPILSPFTDDFTSGFFDYDIRYTEDPASNNLDIFGHLHIESDTINSFLEDGSAYRGVFINCLQTFFNDLFYISGNEFSISMPAGKLRGLVRVRPVIMNRTKVTVDGGEVHYEFDNDSLVVSPNNFLAIGEEARFHAGHEKLANLESIFKLTKSDIIDPGKIDVNLDSDYIEITAHPDVFVAIQNLRGKKKGKLQLINSIYFSAVMAVLDALAENSYGYAGTRWHRVFIAKCEHLGIDPESSDMIQAAQTLLKNPFSTLAELE